jgi:sugar lactone lactonase YvrE
VGNQGFDLAGGASPATTVLILVEPDGSARVVADDVLFPNGSVITPDGKTLIVAETFAARLTAFTITDDGSLVDRRLFAGLNGAFPDGIALDAEGAVWVASPPTHEVLRVAAGGEVLDRVATGEHEAIACALGGLDRRTLYICTSSTHDPVEAMARRDARIEAVEVDVPGAGWP